jgi:hypothetical protein
MFSKFWSEHFKARDHLEDLGIDYRILLTYILGKQCVKVWPGFD